MSSTTIIAIITALIIGSFTLSGIFHTRQQALRKRKLILKLLKQKAEEALSAKTLLLQVDKDYDLILKLQIIAVNTLSKAVSLNHDDDAIQASLNTQKTKLNEYKRLQRDNEVTYWLTSDAELTSTQSQLASIDKLLDLYRNKGDLSESKHHELKHHLNSLRQQLSENTYLYQADIFGEQNNITSYQLYIKRAIQTIKKSNIEDTQKIQKIKRLSDRIQEVRNAGRANKLPNLIKPSESAALNDVEKVSISE